MKSTPIVLVLASALAGAAELHVSASGGSDKNPGAAAAPLKTIQAAANKAMPGDTITVHAGIYRERINPPRGGVSDARRIVYQAAPGEKVVITGSEAFTTWQRVSGDVWKLRLPNSHFGAFNPYAEKVHGDWFSGQGRVHHRGTIYLNGEWVAEAPNGDAATAPTGPPMWFATVDGVVDENPGYLVNIASIRISDGSAVPAASATARSGTQNAACSEGGQCVGFITQGCWLRYNGVDFGTGTEAVAIRAAAIPGAGGIVELRDGHFDGPLLGTCEVLPTGDWQKWQSFTAKIRKIAGKKDLFLVFKSLAAAKAEAAAGADAMTAITARFPAGTDPNNGTVEVCVRPTVFTPEKTNIDFITVRGFELRNAATNWAAPTAGQVGLVTAYWCKGWVIENNKICYSRCCGIALGKYSDRWDGKRGSTEGYYLTIEDALKKDGWSKEKIGGHIVRNNHIHHCGQTGIVGSLGCAFSRIEGNDIHDCNMQGIWSGAEMGGIKFHGAIDVVIADNHIYRNGAPGGLWLDWMAQGTRITGNLFHDNHGHDLFTEVDHGPILAANNIFLSGGTYLCNSRGTAFAHNLVLGSLQIVPDGRHTPFMKPHSTETLGMPDCPVGDTRWYNNILGNRANLDAWNQAGPQWPCAMSGNVFTKGARASKFDTAALAKPEHDTASKLVERGGAWYLTLMSDPAWAKEQTRRTVATAMLGKAVIPNQDFTAPDGKPVRIDTDFLGVKRDPNNPFPGPFEKPANGEVRVWPKPQTPGKGTPESGNP
ncbi:MAG: carbohydrate-binding protein [Verrucomicrobia bacterium]|nr:carbohydrate-binding protein [Verrucomicrobiota bacterium]